MQAAAKAGDDRAGLAGRAQPGQASLASADTGVPRHGVQVMMNHGDRSAVEGGLQRISLLLGSVGLDHRQVAGLQPGGFWPPPARVRSNRSGQVTKRNWSTSSTCTCSRARAHVTA